MQKMGSEYISPGRGQQNGQPGEMYSDPIFCCVTPGEMEQMLEDLTNLEIQ